MNYEGGGLLLRKLCNEDIRRTLKEAGVRQYEVADYLRITEEWLSKKLRRELPDSEKAVFLEAVKAICAEREEELI